MARLRAGPSVPLKAAPAVLALSIGAFSLQLCTSVQEYGI